MIVVFVDQNKKNFYNEKKFEIARAIKNTLKKKSKFFKNNENNKKKNNKNFKTKNRDKNFYKCCNSPNHAKTFCFYKYSNLRFRN